MLVNKELEPYFKAAAALGVMLLLGDMLLSAKFGWTISTEMTVIVAAISLASGILPVIGWFFLRAGHKGVASVIMAAWVLAAFPFNVYSNMGVSTANRMGEVQNAGLKRETYDQRKEAVDEAKAKLDMFSGHLAALQEQHPWSASVTADSLREQAATLDKAIAEEGSKKNGGCKRKCLDLMAKKKEIDGQIGIAEKRVDYVKQIDGTRAVLEKARADLAQTDGGVSVTANQSSLYAKIVSFDLGGDPDTRSVAVANELTGIITAFVLAVLAFATTLAGAYPALMKVGRINVNAREITIDGDEPEKEAQASATPAKPNVHVIERKTMIDDSAFRAWKESLPMRLATV